MTNEDIDKIIKKLKDTIKILESNKIVEQLEGKISLDETPKTNSKQKEIENFFERQWSKLKSTPYDKKKNVVKDTKSKLFEYSEEDIDRAIDIYLKNTDEKYRFKRDRFFNDAIWSYLDMVKEEKCNVTRYEFKPFK